MNLVPIPPLTQEQLDKRVIDIEIVVHRTALSGQTLRWAVLTLDNGFAVTGEPSCSSDPTRDDHARGAEIATNNAKRRLWELQGFLMKEDAHRREVLLTTQQPKPPGPWICASCCTTFPDGMPDRCPHSDTNGCNQALAQGK